MDENSFLRKECYSKYTKLLRLKNKKIYNPVKQGQNTLLDTATKMANKYSDIHSQIKKMSCH
jgi:hypothetical protein